MAEVVALPIEDSKRSPATSPLLAEMATSFQSMRDPSGMQDEAEESSTLLLSQLTQPAVADEKEERPSLSYKDLIIEAIESSPEKRLKLSEIYQVITLYHGSDKNKTQSIKRSLDDGPAASHESKILSLFHFCRITCARSPLPTIPQHTINDWAPIAKHERSFFVWPFIVKRKMPARKSVRGNEQLQMNDCVSQQNEKEKAT